MPIWESISHSWHGGAACNSSYNAKPPWLCLGPCFSRSGTVFRECFLFDWSLAWKCKMSDWITRMLLRGEDRRGVGGSRGGLPSHRGRGTASQLAIGLIQQLNTRNTADYGTVWNNFLPHSVSHTPHGVAIGWQCELSVGQLAMSGAPRCADLTLVLKNDFTLALFQLPFSP